MSCLTRAQEQRIGRELDDPDIAVARRARNRLVVGSMKVCEFEARRFRGQGVDEDDLTQEGARALMTAASRWDPSRGLRFSTYAQHLVRGRMKAAVEKHGEAIYRPPAVRRLGGQISAMIDCEPGLDAGDIADRLGVSRERVVAAWTSPRVVMSTDAPRVDDRDQEAEPWEPVAEEPPVAIEDLIDLRDAIASLPDDERRVLDLHWLQERTVHETQRATHRDNASVRRSEQSGLTALSAVLA